MLARHHREDFVEFAQVARNYLECCPELQHVGRVHDVLGRRAPVKVTASLRKLVNERQDRITDDLRFVP